LPGEAELENRRCEPPGSLMMMGGSSRARLAIDEEIGLRDCGDARLACSRWSWVGERFGRNGLAVERCGIHVFDVNSDGVVRIRS